MTAALDPRVARRKSSRAATASRRKTAAMRSSQPDAKQPDAKQLDAEQPGTKVVSLQQRAIAKQSNSSRSNSSRSNSFQSTVQPLPPPPPLPLWLRGLFALQQGSTLMMLLLVTAGLGVYGWTVYTQQRWGDAYQRLENLQKRERQFLTTNEVLKNQMAEQAEAPGMGLVPPDPNSTIFLSPAPLRPAAAPEVAPSPDTPIPARPLGY